MRARGERMGDGEIEERGEQGVREESRGEGSEMRARGRRRERGERREREREREGREGR